MSAAPRKHGRFHRWMCESRIVAGLLFSADRKKVMIACRTGTRPQYDFWEFPGGIVDVGAETEKHALKRAWFQRFGAEINVFEDVAWYDFLTSSRVILYRIELSEPSAKVEPKGTEHSAVEWVSLEDIRHKAPVMFGMGHFVNRLKRKPFCTVCGCSEFYTHRFYRNTLSNSGRYCQQCHTPRPVRAGEGWAPRNRPVAGDILLSVPFENPPIKREAAQTARLSAEEAQSILKNVRKSRP